eukprot:Opistho-1_new@51971
MDSPPSLLTLPDELFVFHLAPLLREPDSDGCRSLSCSCSTWRPCCGSPIATAVAPSRTRAVVCSACFAVNVYTLKDATATRFFTDAAFRKLVTESLPRDRLVLSLRISAAVVSGDLSPLSGVHTLNLFECMGVKDVSALGGVYDLDLRYCRNVSDVSALGGVHTLLLRD